MRRRYAARAGAGLRARQVAFLRGLDGVYGHMPDAPYRRQADQLEAAAEPVVMAGWDVGDAVRDAQPDDWFRLEPDDRVVQVRRNPDCRGQHHPGCRLDHEHWLPV